MDNIINKILTIENKAKSIIQEAEQEKESKIKDTKEKIEQMHIHINQMAEAKKEEIKERELLYANKKIDEIKQSTEKKVKAMKNHVEKNIEIWTNEIFNRIIGSE